MLSTGFTLIVIIVGFVVVALQISRLSQAVETLAQSVGNIERHVSPNGGDPDWPTMNANGLLDAPPPGARDHKSLAALLRGIYCGNAYTVQLLNHRFGKEDL